MGRLARRGAAGKERGGFPLSSAETHPVLVFAPRYLGNLPLCTTLSPWHPGTFTQAQVRACLLLSGVLIHLQSQPGRSDLGALGNLVLLKPHGQSCFCLPQQKRKLRIFISNTFNPAKSDAEDGEGTVASWELRVEGRLLEDVSSGSMVVGAQGGSCWEGAVLCGQQET